jgi:hypothetical protein
MKDVTFRADDYTLDADRRKATAAALLARAAECEE